ncbi:hypothetical protein K9M43_04705, partial [Candidatus Gracilibacteria bacterium]|nr:hypothetical protein [Candidatus Gracilibacteria bacterium]
MAENQNTNNSQVSASSAVVAGDVVARKTSAEIEAASHKADSQSLPEKTETLFKPIPKEDSKPSEQSAVAPKVQLKEVQPKPVAKIAPVVPKISSVVPTIAPKVAAPLPQNSAQMASAIGLTSAQIEKQSGKTTIPKVGEQLKVAPKNQFKPVVKTAPVPTKITPTSKVTPATSDTTASKLVSKISSIFKAKP